MRLDCTFTDQIIADFNRFWRCKHVGETLEISTPYKMPDSSLLTISLTQRGERLIACDGGQIWEILQQFPDLNNIDTRSELTSLAQAHHMKEGSGEGGIPLYFKETTEEKILTSVVFDVIAFAALATNALTAFLSEDEKEVASEETRFSTNARQFIQESLRPDQQLTTNQEIEGVTDVRFSAVIQSSSGIAVVSCISGTGPSTFRKNISDASYSFKELWESPLGRSGHLKRTIPLLNSNARGYHPRRLEHRLSELKKEAHGQSAISWAENYILGRIIREFDQANGDV